MFDGRGLWDAEDFILLENRGLGDARDFICLTREDCDA